MVFKLDCGEDSYVGNYKLENCWVLIIGGDFGIGWVVVIVFVCEGVDIVLYFFLGEEKDVEEVVYYIWEVGWKVVFLLVDLRDK